MKDRKKSEFNRSQMLYFEERSFASFGFGVDVAGLIDPKE